MALKPFNSVAGYSVGENPANIILANGDITTTAITVSGISNLGAVGNIKISGGTSGYVLSTDGTGNLTFTAPGAIGIEPAGSNTMVQFNDGGALGATSGLTFNKTNDTLSSGVFSGAHTGNGAGLSSIVGANVTGTVASSTTAGTITANAQPNITSVGTLTSLSVTGNVSAGNVIATHYGSGAGLTGIPGANVTGTVANATYATTSGSTTSATTAGTVTTNAQPNITSVGTLTSLSVTGNVTGANLNGRLGNSGTSNINMAATGNINLAPAGTNRLVITTTGANVTGTLNATSNFVTGGNLTASGTGTHSFSGNIDLNSKNVNNAADPIQAQDLATKAYVDAVASGLHVHPSVIAATTGTLNAASGGTVTYNNGSSGVGATLTTTGTYYLIDGVDIGTVGTRILVKDEADPVRNGIYVFTTNNVLTRASDFNSPSKIEGGDFMFVTQGTSLSDTGWVLTTDSPIIFGTTGLAFAQFSGAGTYTAGTGLNLTGTQFSIANTAVTAGTYGNADRVATFTVNSSGQLTAAANTVLQPNAANLSGTTLNAAVVTSSLTSVGTLTALSVTGNITTASGRFIGNGIGLSSLAGANVTGTVPAATTATSATTAGTVTTNAQPNITSVGTLSAVTVSGNATIGNISGSNANIANSIILGNTRSSWATVTTSSVTANQVIATFSTTGINGVEFLVKGVDSSGAKYSFSKVHAVTDGTSVDWQTFGGATLNGFTGTFACNISAGNLRLQVTPASSNSTVWTTTYRTV